MSKVFERAFRWLLSRRLLQWKQRRYFISHSYADTDLLEVLLRSLPHRIQPMVFPPMVVAVDRVVSNPILERIRECHGLIYLDSPLKDVFLGHLERDYALRRNKPIYRFESEQH